jgi:hypothetical protein
MSELVSLNGLTPEEVLSGNPISQDSVDEVRDQIMILELLQAKNELQKVVSLSATLDTIQVKYQEVVTRYIETAPDNEALVMLPQIIETLTKCLESSYAIINKVVGNEKIMKFQVINNISDSTIEIGSKSETVIGDLTDPVSRDRVRRVVAEILKDIGD